MTATLDHVGFFYSGEDVPALTDLSLDLPAGSMTAVLGPVGSGTSTLCRLFAGLLDARGTITGHVEVEATVGVLGDDPEAQLSGLTSHVGDETQPACRLHGHDPTTARTRARQSLARLGIEDLRHRRLDTLSGGQRQLVALVRIMALGPALLILDQPSQSLDPDMRCRLAGALREHCTRGGTVLITGHQIDELTRASDEIRCLDSGTTLPHSAGAEGVWDTLVDDPSIRESESIVRSTTPMAPAIDPAQTSAAPPTSAAAPAPATPATPLLTVRDLSVSRAGSRVLDHVTIDLHAGEFVTLTGANGTGKSTLLRALIGLLERSAQVTGTMTHLGEGDRPDEAVSLGQLPAHLRSRYLGWVGQDPGIQLSAATVRAELMRSAPLPPHPRRERPQAREQRRIAVETVLRATGLTDVADEHPFDLDVPRRKDVVIASALITGVDTLLLDEPTIGRDLAGMDRLSAIIDRFLRRGGAVLAVTHDRRWAEEAAHRRLHLSGGRVSTA
jgi:energy-coupling factor transporter ATP-binding protein EcfA2